MTIAADSSRWRAPCFCAAVVALFALSGAVLRAIPAEVLSLTPDAVIRREIKGGETQSFQIRASVGQFFHVTVEQMGMDVRVILLAPDGHEVAMSDFPNAAWGPEVVAVVAESPGEYTLSLAALDTRAPAGNYEIRLLALRDATREDRDRAAAETAVGNAERLRRQRTAAARSSAFTEYNKALEFFERSGEPYRQGLILNSTGLIHAQSGNMREALPRYERAAQIFHEFGDQRQEGAAVNNVGGAYDVLGDFPKAQQYYQKALALYRATRDQLGEANTLSNIGKLYSDQNDWQQAIDYYRKALPVNESLADKRREATVLGNLGAAYNSLGEYDAARDYFFRALDLDASQGSTLNELGRSFLVQDRYREALDSFEKALEVYRGLGDRRGEGWSLNWAGVTEQRLGNTGKALDLLRQSAELLRAAGDRRFEAIALNNLAGVYADSGDYGKSLELAGQALSGVRAVGDRNYEATALLTIAAAHRQLGNLTEARHQAEEALASIERVRVGAGAEQTRASYFASKQDAYAFTIDLLMEMHRRDRGAALDATAFDISERSRARSLAEMLAESGGQIREGVDPALLVREREISDSLNAKGARLLPLLGQNDARVAALQQDIGDLERDHNDLQAAIRKSSPRYAALTQPQPLTVNQIQSGILDGDTLLLEYSLGEQHSFLWVVGKDSLASWELPARAEIEAQVERVSGLLTARSLVKRLETPAERQKRIMQADLALVTAAKELSRMVIGPAEGVLGAKKLVVVPDGALQRLPFSILPVGKGEPLVVTHEVVMLPSASAMAVLRREIAGRKPAPKTLAVFADPVFDRTDARAEKTTVAYARPPASQDATNIESTRILEHLAEPGDSASASLKIPRLPYTAQEADEILGVFRGSANLKAVGFDASRAAATNGQLSDYRYLHFATHGYLDTERPSLSALVLSQVDENNQPLDGFLRVNDIYNTRLSADLVVLSACQTGLGKEVRGEGLMGLTRAFLYAGAPRVIVSLWNVNDRATAELMTKLYRNMLRADMRPAAALRAAQLEMRKQKRWESPYYWAAFVQHGEWR
jgi:CHAT domain-containing protein/Flp pilus assembly protein TadD